MKKLLSVFLAISISVSFFAVPASAAAKLATPEFSISISGDNPVIKISERVKGASHYAVYRLNEDEGRYQRITQIKGPSFTDLDWNLKNDGIARYKVQAITLKNGKVTVKSDISKPKIAQIKKAPAVSSVSVPAVQKKESDATPLLWKVTSPKKQTMYLFGSIHVAEEALYPLPSYIMDAFNSCDYLAVEVDLLAYERDQEESDAEEELLKIMYPRGKTIVDDIGSELHKKAKEAINNVAQEMEISPGFLAMIDSFKPEMWWSLLNQAALKRAGLSSKLGLDYYFLKEADKKGKKILEIESVEEQMDMLTGFSTDVQKEMLESVLNVDGNALAIKMLYNMWKQGDEGLLTAYIKPWEGQELTALDEEYINAMYTKRDLEMTKAAIKYMDEGKTVFYVVGLAHMLGKNSIVDLLKKEGYTVELIEPPVNKAQQSAA